MSNNMSTELMAWCTENALGSKPLLTEKDIENGIQWLYEQGADENDIRNTFEAARTTAKNKGRKKLTKEDIRRSYLGNKKSENLKLKRLSLEQTYDGSGDASEEKQILDLNLFASPEEKAKAILLGMNAYGEFMLKEMNRRKTGIAIAEILTGYSKTCRIHKYKCCKSI